MELKEQKYNKHMWLMSQPNPCEMQECCQCTFLKHFSITKHILAKKKFFIVAIFLKWRFLFYLVNQRMKKIAFIALEALFVAQEKIFEVKSDGGLQKLSFETNFIDLRWFSGVLGSRNGSKRTKIGQKNFKNCNLKLY